MHGLGESLGFAGLANVEPERHAETDEGGEDSDTGQRQLESMRRSFRSGGLSTGEDGRQEIRKVVLTAPERGQGKPSPKNREHCENDERSEHVPRRFVHVNVVLVVALFAKEGEEDETEHVESSQQRGEQADGIKNVASVGAAVFALEGCEQDGVLAEET